MANVDVVARLQLRAEQFSSETGRAFGEMKTRAASAASEVRGAFSSSFAEVQKLVQNALVLPRTSGGSLDLSSEIANLRASEAAAEQNAAAHRELSLAFTAAAAAGRGDAEALKLDADAAAVASLASEKDAQALRDRIAALETVQGELNKTTSATDRNSAAAARAGVSAGQMRSAFQQLGFQVGDIAQGLSQKGVSALTVFSQQSGQVIQAIGLMTNSTEGFLGFMGGPWGAVITAGAVVLIPLIARMIDTSGAAKEAADDMAKAAQGADSFGAASTLLGNIIDVTTGKLKTHNAVLIQYIKLTAEANIVKAQSERRDAREALEGAGNQSFMEKLLTSGALGGPSYGGAGNNQDQIASARAGLATKLKPLQSVLNEYRDAADQYQAIISNPNITREKLKAADDVFGKWVDVTIGKITTLGASSKLAGRDVLAVKKTVADLGRTLMDQRSNQMAIDAIDGKGIDGALVPYKKPGKPKKTPKAKDYTRADNSDEEAILRINQAWTENPKLVEKAAADTLKLDHLYEQISKRPVSAETKKLIEQINAARGAIQSGLNRPYIDFLRTQRESLEVQKLVLAGRDSEANALQTVLRLQEQMGPLNAAQIKQITDSAAQQERIRDLIEDQQRIINASVGSVRVLQQSFDQFLSDIETRPGQALTGIIDGFVGSFKQLRNDLLSNALFGGIDRDIAKYIREITGQRTPKDIIDEQAQGAGTALKSFADTVESITFRLSGGLDALDAGAKGGAGSASSAIQAVLNTNAANDNGNDQDIVITATRRLGENTLKMVSATEIYGKITEKLVDRLADLGIKIPQSIAKQIPILLQGVSYGQLGGGIFSSLGGGKNNQMASGIGGAIGGYLTGKDGPLNKVVSTGLSSIAKGLGSAAGPIGSILGGVLGNVIGGLFNSPKWSNTTLTTTSSGQVAAGANTAGRGSAAISAANAEANSVASAVNSILDQLGATVTKLAPITLGTFDGKYRVDTQGRSGSMDSKHMPGVKDFGSDQQAAIQYAVAYELSHAVIDGISKASQNILAHEGDINSALSKVMLVESIPQDLKAMLDPVGAAVDDLNRKWKHTVDALDEGGATAEQYAQAQQLYKMQLDQVKASTDSASQSLKDFEKSLMIGSASPYSLRDQEATAKAALQPYLDTINAGGSIDQSKYQQAAKDFLDIERQLYGSTQAYFDALDDIQDVTNKAIAATDNAVPITAGVADPFAKINADNAAKTAQGVATGNEIADTHTELLTSIAASLKQLAANGGTLDAGFIGDERLFA